MADELSPKKLFEPSPEEPKTEPLFPAPMQPIFQGGGEDIKPDPLNNPNFNFSGGEDIKKDPLDAQPIPQIFTGGGSQLVNYDFFDFSRQAGYKAFDIFSGSSGAIMAFDNGYLNSTKLYLTPAGIITTSATMSGAIYLTADLNFYTPKNIKGDLFITGNYLFTGWNTISSIVSGAIFKYDGVTETLMGSWGSDSVGTAQTNGVDYPFLIKINIPNTVSFKAGQTLRIKEILNTQGNSGGAASAGIYFATNKTTAGTNKVIVPFKIDT